MRRAAIVAAVILGLSACGGSTPDVSNEIVVPTLIAPTATETPHQRAVKAHKRAVAAHKRAVRAHKRHLQEQQQREAATTAYPGAFCSSPGSHGIASNGNTYTCKGPGQERWRP